MKHPLDDEPLEEMLAPRRPFWVAMGWATLIILGMVLVALAVIRLW